MALLPLCALTPVINGTVSAGIAYRNGTGAVYRLFLADPNNGSRVDRVTAIVGGAESVNGNGGQLRLYLADANGNNMRLYREQLLSATTTGAGTTPTNNRPGETTTWVFPSGLVLGTNSSLWCGQGFYTGTNDQMIWVCEGAHF